MTFICRTASRGRYLKRHVSGQTCIKKTSPCRKLSVAWRSRSCTAPQCSFCPPPTPLPLAIVAAAFNLPARKLHPRTLPRWIKPISSSFTALRRIFGIPREWQRSVMVLDAISVNCKSVRWKSVPRWAELSSSPGCLATAAALLLPAASGWQRWLQSLRSYLPFFSPSPQHPASSKICLLTHLQQYVLAQCRQNILPSLPPIHPNTILYKKYQFVPLNFQVFSSP